MDIQPDLNQICDQDAYLELHPKSKRPKAKKWPDSGQSSDSVTTADGNVGLILGSKSGILDVDLDCREAKALAYTILPKPLASFDRGTPESGHYLYRATSFGPRKSFTNGDAKSTIVELRGDGSQTMVPPSTHPNGEKIRFTSFAPEISSVEYRDLHGSVALLAASSEVAQNWTDGQRHDLALSFSGLCVKHGVDVPLIFQVVRRICELAGDNEEADRLACVKTALEKPTDQLRGFQGLEGCLGKKAAKRISDWVAMYRGKNFAFLPATTRSNADVVNFGQFSNASNVTEANLGEVFGQWLNAKATYVVEAKQWMIWNGSHWEADQANSIVKLAIEFIRDAKDALFETNQHSAAANLSSYESLNRLENLCKLATTDCAVSLTQFDSDDLLLAAPNQWIDLKTASVFDPDPSILVSKSLSTHYSAGGGCPSFEKFLQDIFEEDRELIQYVQRAIGYSLTGQTSEQCLFILIGDGANGKSTFINIVNKLLGDYSKAAASQTLIARGGNSVGDDLVDLVGARLISVSETEEGESLAEAKIKQMTGGDTLKGRPLYGKYVEFEIKGKIWLATNSLPSINNTDHGIWRRIQAIPFNRTFSADEQDRDLARKLQDELPGILNWAIQGCLDWQEQGLNPPKLILDQVAEYKTSMDSVSQFVEQECEVDPSNRFGASKLFEEYRHWCQAMGSKPQSTTSFKKALGKLPGVYQNRTSSGMQWNGIRPALG